MSDLIQDIRSGVRQLRRNLSSSIVAVLTLSLGIGVSTALFSVIDATMVRPLPYPHPERLVRVGPIEDQPNGEAMRPSASMQDMRDFQRADDVFEVVAGSGGAFRGRITDGSEPARIEVVNFTEDYLPIHGVTPLVGRGFTREDCDTGSPLVAMLGYGYWQSRYGGRLNVLGESIRLDDEVATIVGVLPAWFDAKVPVSTPLRVPPAQHASRGTGRVSVIARLRADVSIDRAREQLAARIAPQRGKGPVRHARVWMESSLESTTSRNRTTIAVLVGAVALILLIACVNVAGLLLARGTARETELALRASLGAGRPRLIRQVLTESAVVAIPGGAIGVLLAWVSLDVLVANIPMTMPDHAPIAVNALVLLATVALLIPVAMLVGLAPALRLSRVRIPLVLGRGGRHLGTTFTLRGGQLLIAVETALAVILVAGAGLMIRSFMRISAADLGFNERNLVTMEVLPLDRNAAQQEYFTTLLQQIRIMPGVASAGLVDNFALGGGTSYTSVVADGTKTFSTVFRMMPGYLETIAARVRDGRLPTEAEYASGYRGVIINESAARAYFAGAQAVGRQLARPGDQAPWTVVGVIADLRHGGPLNERSRNAPQVFFPFQQERNDRNQAMTIVLRTDSDIPEVAGQLRRLAMGIGPRVLVERIRSADDAFGDRVITPRRRMVLLTLLGSLGLLLALVGIFGMTAYAVTRRTAEIGVRMACGARPGQVVRQMVRDAAVPVAIGTMIGVGGAIASTRVIASFLFETTPTDPPTLTIVAALLAAAGCVAAFIPARRAATIDPATSLRAE